VRFLPRDGKLCQRFARHAPRLGQMYLYHVYHHDHDHVLRNGKLQPYHPLWSGRSVATATWVLSWTSYRDLSWCNLTSRDCPLLDCGWEKLRVIESFGQSYRHVGPPDPDATGHGMITETHLKASRQSIIISRRDSLKENLNLLLQRSTSDEALQRSMRVWDKALGIFILNRSNSGQHSWEELGVKVFACKMTQPP
jgi:hypothetical protein